MAQSRRPQKEEFEDVVEPRRREGDVQWILHSARLPSYRFAPPTLSPAEFKQATLASPRVQSELRRMSETSGQPLEAMQKEAHAIMEEMGHALSTRSVRGFGFFIAKVMKRLYRSVFVNLNGMMKLREAVREYPVVLLPSHRSYADFLLMSYLCFDYDIPLPVIAAAMDFASMKFFGNLLRRCGAFFIRRSFASDQLYWLLFSEFVRTHLRSGQHPLEFFLEGTRSRTGKSLMPKTGMLGAILESWFLGEVPDVFLVPVSVSHDRILEESLYAYELLGIPKPKESTSGLLKARGILSDDYGNVHFYVHDPISLRQLAEGKVDRAAHNLQPRFTSGLLPDEVKFLKDVALKVVAKQQQRSVISPWCLMAVILIQEPAGLSLSLMSDRLEFFRDILRLFGVQLDWPASLLTDDIIREELRVHHQLASLTPDARVEMVKPAAGLLDRASQCLQLASYRNQLMHGVVRETVLSCVLLALANSGRTSCRDDELWAHFSEIYTLLHREFVLDVSSLPESFALAKANLHQLDSLKVKQESNDVDLVNSVTSSVRFLAKILQPFLYGYRQVVKFFTHEALQTALPSEEKELAKLVQSSVFQLAERSDIHFLDALSLDLIGNAVTSLRQGLALDGATSGSLIDSGSSQLRSIEDRLNFIYSNVRGEILNSSAKL